MNKRFSDYLNLLVLIFLVTGIASCNQTTSPPPIDPLNMDLGYSPGDDFYRFVNGGWLQKNPIPEEYSRYGSFEQLAEENEEKLYALLTEIRKDRNATPGSNRQRIKYYYSSAMDTVTQTNLGTEPIKFIFDRIEEIEDKSQLTEVIAFLQQIGINPVFGLRAGQDRKNTEEMIANIGQGGLGMSDRDYYLNQDTRSTEIRENYELLIEKIFILAGHSKRKAKEARRRIIELETSMAEASMSRLERRDPYATYNKIEIDELKELMPSFKWDTYLTLRNLDIDELNVGQPLFFKNANNLIKEKPLDYWKSYLEWNVLRSTAQYIGKDFEDAHFEFYGKVMTGSEKQRERWKRALASLNSAMGEAVGQEYVALHFPPESKERMIDLVEHLRYAFGQRISQLPWMSNTTKQEAFAKLEKMNVKIGYPDKWTDYSDLEIKDQPFVLNFLAAREFNIKQNLAEIGEPVDRDKWFMSPQTVNAYYSPTMNEIVFPAAILQPPFFYPHGDDAVNFGAIGMVIGHEMTHGFDDQGRRYAKDGNLRDWWTEEDSNRFEERTEVLVEQYNNYVMLDSLTINGRLSLGENIADLGGLTIAFQALQNKLEEGGRPEKIEGFTPEQRFFISYAQIWRNHMRDQRLMQQLNEGPHSPGEARVNGIVYNMKEFYEAFDIKAENSVRFIDPELRAEIW
ncbi:MAG: M13 family metallopeptidase [Bacteroidales bacterium]|nr:M13 family metallopeptidase [Bacteroidales bacterium]